MVSDVETVSGKEMGGFAALNTTLMVSEQNCKLFEQLKWHDIYLRKEEEPLLYVLGVGVVQPA